MKQMSKQELQCFLEFAPHYFRYVNKALDEQVCDHVTGCHYKCQAHTWNTYPLTPQPICFNLQPFAPKFSLRLLLSNFLKIMGSFLEKRHGLMPNLMDMLLKTFLQAFELYHLTFSQELEGKEWIGSNMRDPSTKDGDVFSGGSRGGALGPPLIFLPNWGPKGGKSIFFGCRIPPPPFISGSGWPGYPVIWRFGSSTGVGVIKPLSQRSSCDVLVPKSVMFRVFKNKPLSPA